MNESSRAALRVSGACECGMVSSRIEDKKAPAVCLAWCSAFRRYLVVSPVVSSIVGTDSKSGDFISSDVLHHGF